MITLAKFSIPTFQSQSESGGLSYASISGLNSLLIGYLVPILVFVAGYIKVSKMLQSQYFEVNSLHTNNLVIKI